MTDYFARKLLSQVDELPPARLMLDANQRARAAGFKYEDDSEAVTQLRSEVEEFLKALDSPDLTAIEDEGIDVVRVVLEIIRMRGGDFERGQRENLRKYLKRLSFIEEALEKKGLQWRDVKWPEDTKPLWDKSKEAGL